MVDTGAVVVAILLMIVVWCMDPYIKQQSSEVEVEHRKYPEHGNHGTAGGIIDVDGFST